QSVAREDAIVDVRRLSLWYGKNKALHEISMPAARGKVTALIGPSGCGKSTLLRCVNRLNDLIDGIRIEGELLLHGADVYVGGVDVIDLRRGVGMVFQKPNPFPMSVFDNVAYPLRIHGERSRARLRAAVERSLKAAALWDEVKDRLKDSA